MTEVQPFVHVVEEWLADVAHGAPPVGLQADVIAAAGRTRQRPRLPWAPERATDARRSAILLVAAASVVAVVVVTINLLPGYRGPGGITPASPSASASPPESSGPDAFPSPLPSAGVPVAGRWDVQLVTSGDYRGFDMTINVAAPGWFSDGRFGIQKGAGDAPSARVTFRAFAPQQVYNDPCRGTLGSAVTSAEELVAAVSSIPGTDASEPIRETTLGVGTIRIILTVPEPSYCSVERFALWPDEQGRPHTAMQLGDTIQVWILNYTHLNMINWIEAETRPGASADTWREIEDIVYSVRMPG